MQIDQEIVFSIILYAIAFFLIYFFLYKNYIYSILDPLFVYIFTLSFSSVLVIFTLEDQLYYLINFFLCHIFLFVGFSLTTKYFDKSRYKIIPVSEPTSFYDYKILRLVVYTLFVFYAASNVVLFFTTGFGLLDENPTIAKVETFTKGFGIIQKINYGVGGFIISGLLFFVLSELRRFDLLLLLIVVLITSLEGSKSSLLRIFITFAMLINHRLFSRRHEITSKLNLITPIGVVSVFFIFFTVLFKENVDSEQALFSFVRRLLYGADSTLYFYLPVNIQYFSQFHFWDFPSHLFNQVLGFLRLVPFQEALGNVMVANALPDMKGTIVGPNTSYYIEGQVFFGYYGAFIYSLIVGFCYAFIRQYFFYTRYYSAFWLVLLCCICQQASGLNVEVTMAVTQIFDTCFFVIPVYVLLNLTVHKRLKFRKLHF